MKHTFERYFELFPLIVIILILLGGERRSERLLAPVMTDFTPGKANFGYAIPGGEPVIPRLILR